MQKELSCGAVIYKVAEDKIKFLLVYSKRNEEWGFPKGHIESGETEKEAAQREIFEETGIKNVCFVEGFREEEIYFINNTKDSKEKIEKHSVLFLALALDEPKISENDEIGMCQWFDINDAVSKLNFENKKRILQKAYNVLEFGKK